MGELLVRPVDFGMVYGYFLVVGSRHGIYRDVGQTIRRLRKHANRTQAQLAAQIGLSRAALANIEAGRQQILVHHLYSIAEALELDSPASLMPWTPASTHDSERSYELPLPSKGLSEEQEQDVRLLMSR